MAKRNNVVRFIPEKRRPYIDTYLSVYVHTDNTWESSMFAEWLVRSSCYKANTPDEADVVIFTGGPDVDPQLYGAVPHSTTESSPERDAFDLRMYAKCFEEGIPMFGVCRGAQFLAVMNGFKLYQDINNHNGPHDIWDVYNKKLVPNVSSVHHQAVVYEPHKGMELLAHSANKATERRLDPDNSVNGYRPDVEAFFIPDSCCLGVQGHPEYRGYEEYSEWCVNLLQDFVVLNTDLTWEGSVRRVSSHVRSQRETVLLSNNQKKAS